MLTSRQADFAAAAAMLPAVLDAAAPPRPHLTDRIACAERKAAVSFLLLLVKATLDNVERGVPSTKIERARPGTHYVTYNVILVSPPGDGFVAGALCWSAGMTGLRVRASHEWSRLKFRHSRRLTYAKM